MQTAVGISSNEHHREDAALCGRLKTSYNTAQVEEDGLCLLESRLQSGN
jgi:hypothetical protein